MAIIIKAMEAAAGERLNWAKMNRVPSRSNTSRKLAITSPQPKPSTLSARAMLCTLGMRPAPISRPMMMDAVAAMPKPKARTSISTLLAMV